MEFLYDLEHKDVEFRIVEEIQLKLDFFNYIYRLISKLVILISLKLVNIRNEKIYFIFKKQIKVYGKG